MKDKEFDQLFKDKFEDLEVQPSAGLWNNIAAELKPVKKRAFPFYWAAAAVALMILSVVLIAPDQEKIRLQGTASTVNESSALTGPQVAALSSVKTVVENEVRTYKSTPLVIAPRLDEAAAEKEFKAKQPKLIATRPVVKADDIIIDPKPVEASVIGDNSVVIAKAYVADDTNNGVITEADPAVYKGIRNVGDLVNYVVDKVDKRERKFLKFNTDEDNSSLIGINIGFIKLNSKRHK
ncbi:hypothetical protein [Pedobacter nyackensis]|uniref:hypothetical protein n=1 Tax=Pedobacter nyackensis TaxID=475255 RepID=UPI00292DB8A9|nr:hypothetical protein [Pedobacter nyackensis]